MFDVGDLPVLIFGNCILKTGVIKWPLTPYVYVFYVSRRFFSKSKNTRLFAFLELLHAFARTLHSAGSGGWPFPMLKYKYVFQITYTGEATFSNSTLKLLWFEITKMLIAFIVPY